MSEKYMHPLRTVALAQVGEPYSELDKDERISLKESLDSFIAGENSYEQCCADVMSILNTKAPVDYAKEILSLSDEPLKSTNEHRDTSKPRLWTQAEDKRLIAGLQKFGNSHWAKICQYVGNNRTRAQCSQRWLRSLNPNINKKKWTIEEERKLLELVAKKGQQSWSAIARELGNRCDVQCRYRYRQLKAKRRVKKYLTSKTEPAKLEIKSEPEVYNETTPITSPEPEIIQETTNDSKEAFDSLDGRVSDVFMPEILVDTMWPTARSEETDFSWLNSISYTDFF